MAYRKTFVQRPPPPYFKPKRASSPENPLTPQLFQDMSKKIVQLTKVIYNLTNKSEDQELQIQDLKDNHKKQLQTLEAETKNKIDAYQIKVELLETKLLEEAKIKSRLEEELMILKDFAEGCRLLKSSFQESHIPKLNISACPVTIYSNNHLNVNTFDMLKPRYNSHKNNIMDNKHSTDASSNTLPFGKSDVKQFSDFFHFLEKNADKVKCKRETKQNIPNHSSNKMEKESEKKLEEEFQKKLSTVKAEFEVEKKKLESKILELTKNAEETEKKLLDKLEDVKMDYDLQLEKERLVHKEIQDNLEQQIDLLHSCMQQMARAESEQITSLQDAIQEKETLALQAQAYYKQAQELIEDLKEKVAKKDTELFQLKENIKFTQDTVNLTEISCSKLKIDGKAKELSKSCQLTVDERNKFVSKSEEHQKIENGPLRGDLIELEHKFKKKEENFRSWEKRLILDLNQKNAQVLNLEEKLRHEQQKRASEEKDLAKLRKEMTHQIRNLESYWQERLIRELKKAAHKFEQDKQKLSSSFNKGQRLLKDKIALLQSKMQNSEGRDEIGQNVTEKVKEVEKLLNQKDLIISKLKEEKSALENELLKKQRLPTMFSSQPSLNTTDPVLSLKKPRLERPPLTPQFVRRHSLVNSTPEQYSLRARSQSPARDTNQESLNKNSLIYSKGHRASWTADTKINFFDEKRPLVNETSSEQKSEVNSDKEDPKFLNDSINEDQFLSPETIANHICETIAECDELLASLDEEEKQERLKRERFNQIFTTNIESRI